MSDVDFAFVMRKCPRCGDMFVEPAATSRRDNKTEICAKCGNEEALFDHLLAGNPETKDLEPFWRELKFMRWLLLISQSTQKLTD